MVVLRSRIKSPLKAGFTLVELSIVLVIIGLIIGGVLVGRDLIAAATIRSQISQIEKYNAAVNTFRGKYGYLPGDIPEPYASQQGFAPRGCAPFDCGYAGAGDGNGIIEGVNNAAAFNTNSGLAVPAGEPVFFWNDLTYANGMNINLIGGSFNPPNGIIGPGGDPNLPGISGAALNLWFPQAKIGGGNYIYVYSNNSANWFGLSAVTLIFFNSLSSATSMTVGQAASIDRKIDDGFPQTGNVQATYINNQCRPITSDAATFECGFS